MTAVALCAVTTYALAICLDSNTDQFENEYPVDYSTSKQTISKNHFKRFDKEDKHEHRIMVVIYQIPENIKNVSAFNSLVTVRLKLWSISKWNEMENGEL